MGFEEDRHQRALVNWFRVQYPRHRWLLYHIPNGQNVGPRVGARLKAQGLLRGVPDLHLAFPSKGSHGLYIEMKSSQGRLTSGQLEQAGFLREAGYKVEVCYGFNAAKAVIEDYMEGV